MHYITVCIGLSISLVFITKLILFSVIILIYNFFFYFFCLFLFFLFPDFTIDSVCFNDQQMRANLRSNGSYCLGTNWPGVPNFAKLFVLNRRKTWPNMLNLYLYRFVLKAISIFSLSYLFYSSSLCFFIHHLPFSFADNFLS